MYTLAISLGIYCGMVIFLGLIFDDGESDLAIIWWPLTLIFFALCGIISVIIAIASVITFLWPGDRQSSEDVLMKCQNGVSVITVSGETWEAILELETKEGQPA
ncbi:MAG: hypothetical protein WC227_01460 [Patescibacteria group bacterium]|jgi:cytochrome bd-type quinol oxidase subunit 2